MRNLPLRRALLHRRQLIGGDVNSHVLAVGYILLLLRCFNSRRKGKIQR